MQLGAGPINELQYCGCTTLKGSDVLERLAVTFVKNLGSCVQRLEIFWISWEVAFRLRGRVGLPVGFISASGSLVDGGINRSDLLGLFGHPFLWCLLFLLAGSLLPRRGVWDWRIADRVGGGRGSLLNRKHGGGWTGGNRGLLDGH